MSMERKTQDHHKTGLFGLYRWVLAAMVAVSHLAPKEIIHMGYYAVFGFFTLSGYLMAMVLHEKYFQRTHGVRQYYINRFLRIYPLYAVVAIVSYLGIAWLPEAASQVHERMILPETLFEKIANITILGTTSLGGFRLDAIVIPPAWSLGIEIAFWCLFPLLFRFQTLLQTWTIFSLAFLVTLVFEPTSLILRYFSPIGSTAAFCAGVWLYRTQTSQRAIQHTTGLAAIACLLLVSLLAHRLFTDTLFEGFYLALVLNIAVIHYLSRIKIAHLPPFIQKLDRLAGDLSYPLFLVHILAGLCVLVAFEGSVPVRTMGFFALSFALSHLFALILWYGMDRHIQKRRQRIA